VAGWRDANEKFIARKLDGCFVFFRSHQLITASKFQEKNNMLVFKTPMNGLNTVGCNQIIKLRLDNARFFGNHRLPPENHKNVPVFEIYSPSSPTFKIGTSFDMPIGTSFDMPNRQLSITETDD